MMNDADNLELNLMNGIAANHQAQTDEAFFGINEWPYDPAMLTLNPAGPEFAAGPGAAEAMAPQPGAMQRVTGTDINAPSTAESVTGMVNKGLSMATPFLQERHRPQIPNLAALPGVHEAAKGADLYVGLAPHVIYSTLEPVIDQMGLPPEWKDALKNTLQIFSSFVMPGTIANRAGMKAAERVAPLANKAGAAMAEQRGSLGWIDKSGEASGYEKVSDNLLGFSNKRTLTGSGTSGQPFSESRYPFELNVRVTIPGDKPFEDSIRGMNAKQALERARRNWPGAKIEVQGGTE